MKTLLRIDASTRTRGSQSRLLADHYETRWRARYPDGRVVHRDIGRMPPPHLDEPTIAAFSSPDPGERVALSNAIVDELLAATELLISSPLYNFGSPSSLKAYFDHLLRYGRTFIRDQRGYVGLASGRTGVIITARGGRSVPERTEDFQTPHLRAMLAFIGINGVDHVALEGTVLDESSQARSVAAARVQIDRLFEDR
jgi:FMN-dependent NADH-azoreductase